MGNERAEELIRKYLEGTATPKEEALLENWYIETAQDRPDLPGRADFEKIRDEILQQLRAELPDQPKIKSLVRLWPRIAAAAAILTILSIGSFFIFHKTPTEHLAEKKRPENDILPAGTRAMLTLLDGRAILLDSTASPTLARQGNRIISTLDGQLTYSANEPDQPVTTGATAYNTLTTRPGEHFSLVLPDGTKAWLNAASSITYPVVFSGNERKVTVTGEVYFEIFHNAKQPFKISAKNELVEDLGTHLNINAYDDESTTFTTLLEGRVKVSKGSASAILKPGQQATIRPGDNFFQLKKVDADDVIAWKNGYFYFDRADIQTIMRQLARWYNIEVVYKGEISKKTFKGKLYRNVNASVALQILAYFGAHFQIDDKTITVTF